MTTTFNVRVDGYDWTIEVMPDGQWRRPQGGWKRPEQAAEMGERFAMLHADAVSRLAGESR